jgi:hypothetical protein
LLEKFFVCLNVYFLTTFLCLFATVLLYLFFLTAYLALSLHAHHMPLCALLAVF